MPSWTPARLACSSASFAFGRTCCKCSRTPTRLTLAARCAGRSPVGFRPSVEASAAAVSAVAVVMAVAVVIAVAVAVAVAVEAEAEAEAEAEVEAEVEAEAGVAPLWSTAACFSFRPRVS